MGSEPTDPSLRLVWLWAQNQPNFRPNRQNAGNFAENPCIPGIYPATAWVFCRFPQFCLRFCPRPALRLRENSEFPEWSTKHPLFSLEISGNAKCWGPSVFLFVFRKTWLSPTSCHDAPEARRGPQAQRQHQSWRYKVSEERVDLSNDMTWRQMVAVGVRRVVLARGELDKLEGPGYAARRAAFVPP